MRDQLKQLEELQTHDAKIQELEQSLKAIPAKLAATEVDLARVGLRHGRRGWRGRHDAAAQEGERVRDRRPPSTGGRGHPGGAGRALRRDGSSPSVNRLDRAGCAV